MKELHRFLKVFIFVQLGACSGRVLTRYLDYINHPARYAMQSAPWYDSLLLTVLLTAITVTLTAIAYFTVGRILKKRGEEQAEEQTPP